MEREKHTKSGRLLEVDFFPVWADGRRMPTRAPKTKRSTAEQAKYNQKKAIKNFVRLVNANFDTGDNILTLTYIADRAPQTEECARRDIQNFFRRAKTKRASELRRIAELLKANPQDKELRKRKKKLEEPFRYMYRIGQQIYKTGKNKGRSNWHFHIFLTGGIDRDALEDLWPLGVRVNADRYQPERFGPEAAAKYFAKEEEGRRIFGFSKNLQRPKQPKPKDGKITRRGVERLAKERADDREYWERRYKGYRFIRCFPRYNNYNGHWYLSVIMYKATRGEELPPWEVEERNDE